MEFCRVGGSHAGSPLEGLLVFGVVGPAFVLVAPFWKLRLAKEALGGDVSNSVPAKDLNLLP